MTQVWTRDNGNCLVILSVVFSIFIFSLALFTIWSISLCTTNNTKGSRVADTLKFVIVVTRHGNRGTLGNIPNDPYPINDTKFWPYGQGGLTPHGRVQMYNLGAMIRALYDGFIDLSYDTKDFYASSTAIDRTLLSGEAFLAGLYPLTNQRSLDKTFLLQLIPLYSNSLDKTLDVEYCEKVQSIRNTTVKKFAEENAAVLKGLNEYLSEYLGKNATGPTGFFSSWDTIISESTEGYSLPSWMQQIFPHPLIDVASKYYLEFVAGTNELVKLIMGDFYEELIEVMKSKVGGSLSPDRKMYFYSGHDFTLITLQAILGIPKSSMIGVVKPGSAMLFELHQDPNTKEFYIEVLYIDGSSEDLTPQRLPIPNCNPNSPNCYFHELVKNTQQIYTNLPSYKEECQQPS